jgi:hypothetical protein
LMTVNGYVEFNALSPYCIWTKAVLKTAKPFRCILMKSLLSKQIFSEKRTFLL